MFGSSLSAAAVSIYTFIGFIYDGLEVFLAQTISLRIAPQFDNPYLAESLASFWGKRWNLPMGICLREAIYEPICEGMPTKHVKVCYKCPKHGLVLQISCRKLVGHLFES